MASRSAATSGIARSAIHHSSRCRATVIDGFKHLANRMKDAVLPIAHRAMIAEAIAALRAGELVVYPTETFYGIAADPESSAALAKILALKEREPGKPIALIAADTASAFSLAREIPPLAHRL